MKHRGPDGQGFCTNFKCGLALAQARLAIIDPSSDGRQPFFSEDKSIVTVFNGEIYNYKELRTELEKCGHIFKTNTDTEVIVQAFEKWGIACLDRLFGMFAIAIFDTKNQEFFLVRDRIGIKPIYFSLNGGFLSFASEHKALFNLPWITKDPNPLSIYHFLTFMACPAPLSFSRGIYKLPAGYFLRVNAQKNIEFKEWYCPIKATSLNVEENKNITLNDAVERLEFLLNKSVERRMIADVPVTVFLSGGLDSSLMTAIASNFSNKINTFNVSFKNQPSTDERFWARNISEIFKTNHHELEIDDSQIDELIEQMQSACDGPLADCVNIPFFALSKLVSSLGFKVALIGEGADELFFGYPEYQKYAQINDYFSRKLATIIPGFFRQILAKGSKILSAKASIVDFFENWACGKELFWGAAIAFRENEKFELRKAWFQNKNNYIDEVVCKIFPNFNQGPDSTNIIELHKKKILEHFPNADFHQKIAFLELKNRLPELLLARADNMGMASGLEARVPFLDHQLIEFVLSLPENIRMLNGQLKPLLKLVAQKTLPLNCVNRKKVGFSAPIDEWFLKNKLQDQKILPAKKTLLTTMESCIKPGAENAVKKWVLHSLSHYFQT